MLRHGDSHGTSLTHDVPLASVVGQARDWRATALSVVSETDNWIGLLV
jgi:hypothetical protein